MEFIKWDDDLSVHIASIDQQHEKLILMVNGFFDAAVVRKKKDEALGGLLDGLTAYTLQHFATEEELFRKFSYPDADEHKAEHRALIEKVTGLKERFSNDRSILSVEIMNFLKGWILNHIKVIDAKYSGFLKEKGVR